MRRRRAEKREIIPDPKYNNVTVAKFINIIMTRGKRATAEKIVYKCFDILSEKTGKQGLEAFQKALDNVRPLLEVKPRRIGGATYQVPVDVKQERGISIAMRWIRNFARVKKGKPMEIKLALEMLDAYKGEGLAIKKRDDTHKMAEANKAFAHYRW
ncbi:MAG: 30S ribosomal protein S7 [Candidatus Omnitrophica bacterium]|nr:30S ribosomal protein S7 [Candidatus Omnitrophota bacterium]MBI5143715.1 30S ribosomal protein S7 [Candidatus Omnitrophota bacterium]